MKNILIVLILFLSQQVFSQNAFWKEINQYYPGFVYDIASNDRGDVFVATESSSTLSTIKGGIYRTINNGASWDYVGLSDCGAVACIGDTVFAREIINVNNQSIEKLYRSIDNGNSWSLVYDNFFGWKIIIDSQMNLYTTTNSDVYLSKDGGYNWQKLNTPWGSTHILSFLIYKKNIFIGTDGMGVYQSSDEGNTWNGGGTTHISYLVGSNDNVFAAAGSDGLFRSSDLGKSWINISIENHTSVGSITEYNNSVLARVDSLLYPYPSHIFRTTDNGLTWNLVGDPGSSGPIFCNSNGYLFSYDLFGGNQNDFILRSSDYGANWMHPSLRDNWVLTFLSTTQEEFFIGTLGNSIFRTSDNGNSYVQVDNGITNTKIITAIQTTKGDIFVGTDGDGIFHSTDDGNSWYSVNNELGINKHIYSIVVGNNGDLLAACNPDSINKGFVYRSTDNGESWQSLLSVNSNIYTICADSSKNIFAGAYYGNFYRSTDDGNNWNLITTFPNTANLRALLIAPDGTIFAGTDYPGGLWRSTNNGDNWEQLGFTDISVTSFILDKASNIWLGTFGNGIYESTDMGATWIQTNSGLKDQKILSLGITSDGYLLAGTSSWGIFESNSPVTSIEDKQEKSSLSFSLLQNYPNPFNPTTKIQYSISKSSFVTIKVYDILGKVVATLVNEEKRPGNYSVVFHAASLSSGIYFYRLQAGGFTETKKLIFLK